MWNKIIERIFINAKGKILPKIVPVICAGVVAIAGFASVKYPVFTDIINVFRDQATNAVVRNETTITNAVGSLLTPAK